MLPDAATVKINCPAKVNLSLAILGRREDGFHDLHSVVAKTLLGDELELSWDPHGQAEDDQIMVDGCELPAGENTVSTAIRLFREASGLSTGGITAHLTKLIPVGAGLGGGSSDAVSALKALRQLFGSLNPDIDWIGLAEAIGSDCPLFFSDQPVIMEGRGEQIRPLDDAMAARFRGKPVILFKPRFSINTGEAYRRLAAKPYYQSPATAQADMAAWEVGTEPLPPRNNDFERLVEDWIPSLAVVLARLRIRHGLEARMSGSGSACFIFPQQAQFAKKVITDELAQAFGEDYWLEQTAFD